MTEQEWLGCNYPIPMVNLIRENLSYRKSRLFAVACCRRTIHLLTEESSRKALNASELFADNQITVDELHSAMETAVYAISQSDLSQVYHAKLSVIMDHGNRDSVEWLDRLGELSVKARAFDNPSLCHFDTRAADEEEAAQCHLLRDIVGNPFRPVSADSSWITWNNSTVPKLAQVIYDDRAFDQLPILADALQDAGCHSEDILNHCRSEGPHVRGCWVLDLLLGKE